MRLLTLQRYLIKIMIDTVAMICHTTQQPLKIGGKSCYPLQDATSTCTRFQNLTSARAMLKIL